ncbi:hypothetical protein D3C83_231490 [compost metagenome]
MDSESLSRRRDRRGEAPVVLLLHGHERGDVEGFVEAEAEVLFPLVPSPLVGEG